MYSSGLWQRWGFPGPKIAIGAFRGVRNGPSVVKGTAKVSLVFKQLQSFFTKEELLSVCSGPISLMGCISTLKSGIFISANIFLKSLRISLWFCDGNVRMSTSMKHASGMTFGAFPPWI